MKAASLLAIAAAPLFFAVGQAFSDGLKLSTDEGVYGMVVRDRTPPEPVLLKIRLSSPHPDGSAKVLLSAKDMFGKVIPWNREISVPATGAAEASVDFPGDFGCCEITARLEGAQASDTLELGIIRPPHPGLRKESFFASNTSGLKSGQDLEFLRVIGMKIQRAHFEPRITWTAAEWQKPPTGTALPLDFSEQDEAFAECVKAGLWVLPVAAYALDPTYGRTPLAVRLGMHGPPRNSEEFVHTWEEILRHYPDITAYEFWNEPWIFGWTWAATPSDYRALQKLWCQAALKINPRIRIVAGSSSMFARDNIAPDPDCFEGLLQGLSDHPYTHSVDAASFRAGDNRRSIDDGMDATRRMGLSCYYLTEGGTEYRPAPSPERADLEKRQAAAFARMRDFVTPEEKKSAEAMRAQAENDALSQKLAAMPEPGNNIENAAKLVQYYVNAALVGAFMGNAQWDLGYGPKWTRCNTAFATMTHFLEDRPIVADIWPGQQLITGAVFASPKWIDDEVRSLPRAEELGARWKVAMPPGRASDRTRVAVIWSLTGPDAEHLDTQGRLTIGNPGDIRAYDLSGREIPPGKNGLVIPFGPEPVFLTSGKLGIAEFRNRIARAAISGVTPVNAYALSLAHPMGESQPLGVRLQNQVNCTVSGTIEVRAGKTSLSAPFTIPAGKLTEISLQWPGSDSPENAPLQIEIRGGDNYQPFSREQVLQEAHFAHRTITVDGDLGDWEGVSPVSLDSASMAPGSDQSQALLNPGLAIANSGTSRIRMKMYAAYDADNVYLAAVVDEPSFHCTEGQPVVKGRRTEKVQLPYTKGMPDGLDHIVTCGDVLQFAFGFRDRVPQAGRQMKDPYAWKGSFYDTDYCYAAWHGRDGDRIVRLYGPNTPRCNGYQTEATPGMEILHDAKIKILRDEPHQRTTYELAIPRSELSLFNPQAERLRFGFILYNDEKLGPNGGLAWSDAAGVFDYWRSLGSYPPNWYTSLPCQTFFGIDHDNKVGKSQEK